MASIKTNKIKKRTPLVLTKFLRYKSLLLVPKRMLALKHLKFHLTSALHGSVSLRYSECAMFYHTKNDALSIITMLYIPEAKKPLTHSRFFCSSSIFPHSDMSKELWV